ncbi:MAG: GFA family protein [Caldimonas sp.]
METEVIQGSCLCGEVRWQFEGRPDGATACNCTACRRYGVLWAYDYENEGIKVSGTTQTYVRGGALAFHFCPACGCMAFWRGLQKNAEGRLRIAVNLRLAEPETVAQIPIDHFDGLNAFEDLPRDGRCVSDYWF